MFDREIGSVVVGRIDKVDLSGKIRSNLVIRVVPLTSSLVLVKLTLSLIKLAGALFEERIKCFFTQALAIR